MKWTIPWMIAIFLWSVQTLGLEVSVFQASRPEYSLIEVEHNGRIDKFLVPNKQLEDPQLIESIATKIESIDSPTAAPR